MKVGTFKKYYPGVWVACMLEECERGEVIQVENRYGDKKEYVVYNLVRETTVDQQPCYYYSITRADGYNSRERAKAKAEKYNEWAEARRRNSDKYHEASNEGRDFLVLAEPIKVGHHSERGHRALIERNWARMEKSVENADKAKEHERKAEAWEKRANNIDLSMPESLEYYSDELKKAIEHQQLLKSKPELREHAYSLTYATKKVKELTKKVEIAKTLWG